MNAKWIVGLVIVAAAALALVGEHSRRQDAASYWRGKYDAQLVETKQWQARFAEASSHVQRSVDTVRVRVTRVDSLRDTVLQHLTDTLLVTRFVAATDSANRACTQLANDCTQFRHIADSTLAAKDKLLAIWQQRYDAVRPRWYQRFGVSVGYGAMFGPDRTVVHGPNVSVGVRVWP